MGYMENYKKWCEDTYFDEATRAELKAIEGNDKEIQERFYKDLEFGTGGLRGIIGAGTNRLNIYTVSKATQGFANYIIKQGEEAVKKGVAIAFDSRRMSPEFAEITALVLNGNGIKTYIYPSLRPTPMLSFAVREQVVLLLPQATIHRNTMAIKYTGQTVVRFLTQEMRLLLKKLMLLLTSTQSRQLTKMRLLRLVFSTLLAKK